MGSINVYKILIQFFKCESGKSFGYLQLLILLIVRTCVRYVDVDRLLLISTQSIIYYIHDDADNDDHHNIQLPTPPILYTTIRPLKKIEWQVKMTRRQQQ